MRHPAGSQGLPITTTHYEPPQPDGSAVGVLVERTTRLVLLAKMDDATAESALEAFSAKLRAIAAPLRQTLTRDQGREMASHRALIERTGVKVCYCDPHSPGQRGTRENTNGLLRRYLALGHRPLDTRPARPRRHRRRDEQPLPCRP